MRERGEKVAGVQGCRVERVGKVERVARVTGRRKPGNGQEGARQAKKSPSVKQKAGSEWGSRGR
jgi:hypothetical protein